MCLVVVRLVISSAPRYFSLLGLLSHAYWALPGPGLLKFQVVASGCLVNFSDDWQLIDSNVANAAARKSGTSDLLINSHISS